MNSLNAMELFRFCEAWCFDDQAKGLEKEPFVGGSSEIIDFILDDLGFKRTNRCSLIFSGRSFPGSSHYLLRETEDDGGYYYSLYRKERKENVIPCDIPRGWLCPVTEMFFNGEHPPEIHISIQPII